MIGAVTHRNHAIQPRNATGDQAMQATVKREVVFHGVGLHSGVPARLILRPAPVGQGIVFCRTDLPGRPVVPALWDRVSSARLCTRLEGPDGMSVSTVEHVMAALAGTGIINVTVDVDGPEVPILDGSAAPFVRGILAVGIKRQPGPCRMIRVKRRVEIRAGEAWAALEPAESLEIDFAIDFADAAIGRQHKRLDMANGSFVKELADSRTFCSHSDVAAMQAVGLARGGSYFNAVVYDGDKVLSPGGLRHQDEAVRHKMLDAMGDLALAGAPLLARFSASRGGHALTNQLLRKLFADRTAWEEVECDAMQAARLPGRGLTQPVEAAIMAQGRGGDRATA